MPLTRLTLSIVSNLHGILVPLLVFVFVFTLVCRRSLKMSIDSVYWTFYIALNDGIFHYRHNSYVPSTYTETHTQTHCRLHLEYWLYMILFKCLKWIFDVKCQRNRNLLSAFRKRICNDALHCATHRHYTHIHTFIYIYILNLNRITYKNSNPTCIRFVGNVIIILYIVRSYRHSIQKIHFA